MNSSRKGTEGKLTSEALRGNGGSSMNSSRKGTEGKLTREAPRDNGSVASEGLID
jgi:hypothetical protein